MCKLVLLVDDDANIRENYCDILEEHGLQVVACGNSNAALEIFQSQSFDLVLLDISLHGDRMAGHCLCRNIRQVDPAVPILMLTSLDNEENRRIASENGSLDYLVKSADTTDFLFSVTRFCGTRA